MSNFKSTGAHPTYLDRIVFKSTRPNKKMLSLALGLIAIISDLFLCSQ